jgi:hypothetical protein
VTFEKYKRRPLAIEAFRYIEGMPRPDMVHVEGDQEFIESGNVRYALRWGDWIVRGQSGQYYVCPPVDFERIYEPDC